MARIVFSKNFPIIKSMVMMTMATIEIIRLRVVCIVTESLLSLLAQ